MPEALIAASNDRIVSAMQRAVDAQRPTMRANFTHPAWAMSAAEFRKFWRMPRMSAVATVGANHWPHAAPVEVALEDDLFVVPSFASSLRIVDLRSNARLVLNTWDDAYHVAIVYGTATFDGLRSGMIRVEVAPTRIYAIRAPAGHAAHRAVN